MKQTLHILPAIALAKASLPISVALAKAGLLTTAVFLISSAPSLFGQNFSATDNLALNTPTSKTTSIQSLAQYLCAEQPDDAHKARVLYAWVSLNIVYVDSTDENEVWATPEHLKRQAPMKVLQNRTAVCQGFANLFCALMVEAGLPCEVVTGLAKKADGKIAKLGHAWAAARINGTWQLFDPTWGVPPVGISRWKVVDKYFMADPEHFVLKHLPDDPMWQLLENPVTERRFRDASDEEILEFVDARNEGDFKFRDTLDHWIAMDSASRMFGAESRVLRFNGSNERVVFGLGQRYWGLFFELQYTLDSLTYLAIMYDTTKIDTIRFQKQLGLMERYHKRASLLFERLKTAERVQKTEKFYAPNDVAALLEKIQGDMRAGVFEYLNHGLEGVLTQSQFAQLRYQFNLASQSYHRAESKMNCDKMARNCFDVRHNRSLMAIQLGQQQVRLVQELTNVNKAAAQMKIISLNAREARSLLLQGISDCELMRSRPPKYAFVDERLITARQWLNLLRVTEIRAQRIVLLPELEAVLAAQKMPSKRAESLVENMSLIAQSMEGLADSIKSAGRCSSCDADQSALYNLQIETFGLQFNFANLLYRIAINDYQVAVSQNTLAKQRVRIRYDADRALQALKKARLALEHMENSGQAAASSIEQKQIQFNKLSTGLKDLLKYL